ncbi:MAG TPA: hypothetical protein VFZ66_00935 [Herpetosiphonaceae bacterium]
MPPRSGERGPIYQGSGICWARQGWHGRLFPTMIDLFGQVRASRARAQNTPDADLDGEAASSFEGTAALEGCACSGTPADTSQQPDQLVIDRRIVM